MAFNAKSLSYESKEPEFLRKLRNEYGENASSRHERPLVRPRRAVTEDDDEPTYIMEESQDVMSKNEYDALVQGTQAGSEDTQKDTSRSVDSGAIEPRGECKGSEIVRETEASIGASKKRKPVKVFGENEAEKEDCSEIPSSRKKAKTKKKDVVKLSFGC